MTGDVQGEPNAPIDETHAASVAITGRIRTWVAQAKARAAEWELAPCPTPMRVPRMPEWVRGRMLRDE